MSHQVEDISVREQLLVESFVLLEQCFKNFDLDQAG